ncbi:MAG: RDD family protein [Thermoleophilaceae bacterium]
MWSPPQVAAPLGPRAAAWAIDLLLTVPVPYALYLGFATALFSDDVPFAVAVPTVGALLLFQLLYAPVLLSRRGPHAGQTIGKRALGLRVTRPGGERLDFGKALVRELVARSLLGLIPLYSVLDLLRPLTNDPRRAIHDSLADTLVVRS